MQVQKKIFSSPCTVDLICFSIPDKKSSNQNDIPFKDIKFSKFSYCSRKCNEVDIHEACFHRIRGFGGVRMARARFDVPVYECTSSSFHMNTFASTSIQIKYRVQTETADRVMPL